MINGGAIRATQVLSEVGLLVSAVRDVSLRTLLEKIKLTDNGAVMEAIVEGQNGKFTGEDDA